MSLDLALLGRAAMSALSPLSGAKRKLDFGAVRAAFDPKQTLKTGGLAGPRTHSSQLRGFRFRLFGITVTEAR